MRGRGARVLLVVINGSSKKDKVIPYSVLNVGPSVQAVSPQMTISHSPAVGCHHFSSDLRFTFVSIHQMAPPLTEVTEV